MSSFARKRAAFNGTESGSFAIRAETEASNALAGERGGGWRLRRVDAISLAAVDMFEDFKIIGETYEASGISYLRAALCTIHTLPLSRVTPTTSMDRLPRIGQLRRLLSCQDPPAHCIRQRRPFFDASTGTLML